MSDGLEQEIISEEDGGEAVGKLKKVKEQLKQCQKEKAEYLTGWQREKADFINYKRRQEEQMNEWSRMFGEGLVRDILPVLDTLDASIKSGQGDKDGLVAMRQQLMKILGQHGLTEMESVGQKFSPERHEALEQVEGKEPGMVTEEVLKGYLLNEKVIRVAKVKVSK